MKIIDNWMEPAPFQKIQSFFLGSNCSWFFQNTVDGVEDLDKIDRFQFTHIYVLDGQIRDPQFHSISNFFQRLQTNAYIKVKANLGTRTEKVRKNSFHTDLFKHEITPFHYTAVYYLNTNNGFTLFKTGEKVKSKENRLLIFPSGMEHTGTTCTNQKARVVINFNFVANNLDESW
jgi:hypothetical protein